MQEKIELFSTRHKDQGRAKPKFQEISPLLQDKATIEIANEFAWYPVSCCLEVAVAIPCDHMAAGLP